MKYDLVHDLNIVDKEEMDKIQRDLRNKIRIKCLEKEPEIIGGMDIAYFTDSEGKEKAISVIVLINAQTNQLIDEVFTVENVINPYMPGYFGFREIPLFIKTWDKLNIMPDVMVFDGQGMLHPNRMGLATQGSFFIGIPTIGVGKTFLHYDDVYYQQPENNEGAFTFIKDKEETIGVAYRSHKNVKPIFISIGNFISLEESIHIVGRMITKESRIPVATRFADLETKRIRRELKINY